MRVKSRWVFIGSLVPNVTNPVDDKVKKLPLLLVVFAFKLIEVDDKFNAALLAVILA